ncbi:MAG: NAD(P)/FAD-dependent oxidoreductase [Bacteroidota bacterium]
MMYLPVVKHYDVVIIGGGLAGLTSALDLAKRGKQVVVIEKNTFPQHKVCGEYVSNEVLPYLARLGVSLPQEKLPKISNLRLGTSAGRKLEVGLPLGGFGISRYLLDDLLYKSASSIGVDFHFEMVEKIVFENDVFELQTKQGSFFKAPIVIGAYGKRSNLDKQLKRSFFFKKSSWLGVKAHYSGFDHPDNLVSLHTFSGGYGGLSKVEGGITNFCYLVDYQAFKKAGNHATFTEQVLKRNPWLSQFFEKAIPEFDKPLSIAQVSFRKKLPVENHILMCGDTAGLIHPLCGNGMAMAMHSAKIASDAVTKYFDDASHTRLQMEKAYSSMWKSHFAKRLWWGRRLQNMVMNASLMDTGLQLLPSSEAFWSTVIMQTHGSPIVR